MVASAGGGVDGERPRERCEKSVKLKLCFLKSVSKLFSSLLAALIIIIWDHLIDRQTSANSNPERQYNEDCPPPPHFTSLFGFEGN